MAQPLRVAYVDDDPHLRALVELALQATGCDVALFASGAEALAGVPAFAPDVLLLDVIMPEMDGYETLRQLRAASPLTGARIAFLTGMRRSADLQRCRDHGAAVIAKPIDPMTLGAQVAALAANG